MGLLLRGILTRRLEPIDDTANWQPILDEERSNDHSETWKSMEALLTTGKVRSIGMYLISIITWLTWEGVSNFNLSQLQKLLKTAKVPPTVNQIEIHP
jgi:diketogulonate reductase-like aldo/keto reductase